MKDIPLDVEVEGADGPCGKSIAVIIDPLTQKVTHIAVEPPHAEARLVPVDQVVETAHDLVRLQCTRDELADMETFLETHYVPKGGPAPSRGYFGMDPYAFENPYALYSGEMVPVEEERIPPGELAFHRGADVEATDGHIGKVGEFLIEPQSGHITHLVLMEGHLWGKKEVTLPVSAIAHVEADTVYLKLGKRAVKGLPAIPITRRSGRGEAEVVLVAQVFEDFGAAGRALESLEELHHSKTVRILNAATLVKARDGTTMVQDELDMDPGKGRLLGAITGGLIGLLGGPVGVVAGALVGAGAGDLVLRKSHTGFSDEFLVGLEEWLQPGRAALVVLVEQAWTDKVLESLAGEEGVTLQQTLSDELVEQLLSEGEARA